MTGKEIIASVLARTGVSENGFFGPGREPAQTAARAMAIREMDQIGMSTSAIARIVRRDRTSVRYWQRDEVRQERSAYYQAYYEQRKSETAQNAKPKAVRPRRQAKPKVILPPARQHACFYTAAEDVIARELFNSDALTEECLRVLGRGRDSVRKRVRYLDDPAFHERSRARDRRRQPDRCRRAEDAPPVSKVCPALVEDAANRAVAPRSLTAWSFGDPPPGYSALDRRNAAEARL